MYTIRKFKKNKIILKIYVQKKKMSYMYIPSDAWIVWLDTYFQPNTQMSGML